MVLKISFIKWIFEEKLMAIKEGMTKFIRQRHNSLKKLNRTKKMEEKLKV